MFPISTLRLNLLRAMYSLMSVGLFITMWPAILHPTERLADANSVVLALLGSLGLISLLGLRYPLKMLPVLMFELLWKCVWIIAYAVPLCLGKGLDVYASETLFATGLGVVLVPLVLPWDYIFKHYVTAASEPLRSTMPSAAK
jgi:FtsH-binding integral membrane protein